MLIIASKIESSDVDLLTLTPRHNVKALFFLKDDKFWSCTRFLKTRSFMKPHLLLSKNIFRITFF